MEPNGRAAYNYLPKKVRDRMPMLKATEKVDVADKEVIVKYFGGPVTFYAVEGNAWSDEDQDYTKPLTEWKEGDDVMFFGLVDLLEREWGSFTLAQVREVRVPPFGLPLERDLYFDGRVA